MKDRIDTIFKQASAYISTYIRAQTWTVTSAAFFTLCVAGIGTVGLVSLSGVTNMVADIVTGETKDETAVLAPGWGELGYEVPKPGTYKLPVIRPAGGGKVFRTNGEVADLRDFLHGKITVLNFIYTSCNDINGCPLSTFVLHNMQNRLKQDPDTAAQLQMLSFSFDIEKDTPEVLRTYEQEHHGKHQGHGGDHDASHGDGHGDDHGDGGKSADSDWFFVVSESERELKSTLKAYSQFVIPEINEQQEGTGKFSHLLRVFLIDKRGRVRNIYSPDFLHPDLLLADVKTLLLMDDKS